MSSWISSWFGSSGSQAGEAPKPRRSMSDNATDTWRRLYAPGEIAGVSRLGEGCRRGAEGEGALWRLQPLRM